MNYGIISRRSKEIEARKIVLEKSIIIFIGRRGISYRGKQKGLYTVYYDNCNHDIFLKLVKLVANYDTIFKDHIDLMIVQSEKK